MRTSMAIVGLAATAACVIAPLHAKDDDATPAPQERMLVLPVRFLYAKYGLGDYLEVLPQKSDVAERNLEASLDRALKHEPSGRFVDLPPLTTEEQATVREHTQLLRLVAIGTFIDQAQGSLPWGSDPPWRLEYNIGTGLAFLADRTGVDRAIFVSGARGEPSGGVALVRVAQIVLLQSFLVPPGNFKGVSAVVVNLRSGDVLAAYLPERGFAGEADDVAGANTWMRTLFDAIPKPPLRELRLDEPPRPGKPVRTPRPRRGFVVMRPAGWNLSDSLHLLCFRRHSAALESICIDDKSLGDAVRAKGLTTGVDPMKLGDIAVDALKADPAFADMELTSLTPARIAGRDGFRAELTSRLILDGSRLRERHVVYGVAGPGGAYLVRFDAPAIYFFDRYLPDFEALLPTLKLT